MAILIEMPTKTASRRTTTALPVVRPDWLGYVLDGEWIDGFGDRSELALPARRQIARLAERYAPEEVSDEQRALLVARPDEQASDLLRALAEDEADLDEAFVEGLYDSLTESELVLARSQSYPLPIGKVAELTGASQRQLRHWEEQGLLRSYPVGGQRRYLRGGVVRAMALVTQEQHVLATLSKTVREPTQLVKLIGLALRDSSERDRVAAAAREFISIGEMLNRSLATEGRRSRADRSTRSPVAAGGSYGVLAHKRARGSALSRPDKEGKTMAKKRDVHVLPGDKGWKVKVEGATRAQSTHATQAEAATVGRETARKNQSELLIHGRNGQIRARNTYGHDPRRSKG